MGVPYAAVLRGRDPLAVIAETPGRLMRAFEGKTAEELEARPVPGKWNLREVMAHLADCEIAWSWRLRQAYGEDHAVIQPFEQDAWAKAYDAYTFEAAKATFLALRAWNVAFVGALSEADRSKAVTHPLRGEETLWTLVKIIGGHDLHHLKTLGV